MSEFVDDDDADKARASIVARYKKGQIKQLSHGKMLVL